MKDTIAAISTPLGSGAMGVVRISGSRALEITLALTHKTSLKPRYAHLCSIYDGNDAIDEAIVLYFAAPKSYTCEDVCEIQCHGGVVLTHLILRLVLRLGARLATPGEFTKRAFLNGRIDISQAQAISGLIMAQSEQASKLLASQLKGRLSSFVADCREMLLRALAFSEVMIDYSDEDIPQDTLDSLSSQIEGLYTKFKEILEFSTLRNVFLEGLSLCIVGKPNVGKSSLLNALLSQERAIVSDIAGTTRDVIESSLNLDGQVVKIIDTAGIRDSRDKIEGIGIERSLEAIKESEIIIAVFDSSEALNKEDYSIIQHLSGLNDQQRLILVFNKIDKQSKIDFKILEKDLKAQEVLKVSAYDLGLILKLKEALSRVVQDFAIPKGEVFLFSEYQINIIKTILDALLLAKDKLLKCELELFSYHIKEVLDTLALLTHPYDVDEMFTHMFGEFCLGK